jgi:hypothetical protein
VDRLPVPGGRHRDQHPVQDRDNVGADDLRAADLPGPGASRPAGPVFSLAGPSDLPAAAAMCAVWSWLVSVVFMGPSRSRVLVPVGEHECGGWPRDFRSFETSQVRGYMAEGGRIGGVTSRPRLPGAGRQQVSALNSPGRCSNWNCPNWNCWSPSRRRHRRRGRGTTSWRRRWVRPLYWSRRSESDQAG